CCARWPSDEYVRRTGSEARAVRAGRPEESSARRRARKATIEGAKHGAAGRKSARRGAGARPLQGAPSDGKSAGTWAPGSRLSYRMAAVRRIGVRGSASACAPMCSAVCEQGDPQAVSGKFHVFHGNIPPILAKGGCKEVRRGRRYGGPRNAGAKRAECLKRALGVKPARHQ